MRKHWIDNLRWVTELLVLSYNVINFYTNKEDINRITSYRDNTEYKQ